MESLEMKAKTVKEAIQLALEQLGVSREEVKITVVREGRSGILGMGAEDALVRVEPLEPAAEGAAESGVAEAARETLEKLLALLGVNGSVEVQTEPVVGQSAAASVFLNVIGDDLGILIGRRGQTLASLQYIVRIMLGQQMKTWSLVVIDVEDYKRRRYESLQTFARNMADHVKARGASLTLEPMPAYERRIIHMTLADHPDVVTESYGQGESRRVVILLKEAEEE